MCGIAGIYFKNFKVEKSHLQMMQAGIAHRGPDGSGVYVDTNVALLHSRLSIIDISEKGDQPLYNEERTLILICNGEIYNFKQLRSELESRGHRFFSDSDSEVLLHLYEENTGTPEKLLNQVKGMFAFAIYDTINQSLFIARDRFGIKPLYIANDTSGFYFSSEITSITNIKPEMKSRIDFTSVYEYLQYLSIPEPNTIFKDIKCLPAGHFAIINQGDVKVTLWYDLIENTTNNYLDSDDFSIQLSSTLSKVVHEHTVADVPLGSFLSAGIDSTLVTHLAYPYCNAGFTAISASFPGEIEDESVQAEATARSMGIKQLSYSLSNNFFEDVTKIVSRFDQPFGATSAFSLFKISLEARKHMKVVLTGDGGDEVFAGYDHKHIPFYRPTVVKETPTFLAPGIGKLLNLLPIAKGKTLAQQFLTNDSERFLQRNRVLSANDSLQLIPLSKRNEVDTHRFSDQIESIFSRTKHLSWLHQLLYADISTFLKSEMLYKVDRMTMANALEARVPFLDHEVVELAFQALPKYLRDERGGKLPLRAMVEKNYVGLGWRKKTGFNAPLKKIVDQNGIKAIDLQQNSVIKNWIDNESLKKLTQRYSLGEEQLATVMVSLVSLGAWTDRL